MARPPFVLFTALAAGLFAAAHAAETPRPEGLYAEFATPRGVIVAELFFKETPLTVANFVGLAEGSLGPTPGTPFFDGLKFHRVVPGFVVQGGDPLGTGKGGPGYQFADEFALGRHLDAPGMLAMANSGPDTNGSQFFFALAALPRLDYLHCVFGQIVAGLDVLPQIVQGDTMKVRIVRVGAAAQAFKIDPFVFAGMRSRATTYSGPSDPGPSAPFDDPNKLLPTAEPRARNFNYKLANFERIIGLRVYARVLARLPEPADGAEKWTHATYTQKLARDLGLHRTGVLAVYLADKDAWYLWVGETLLPVFNPDNLRLQDRKRAFYEAVKTQAAAYAAEARKLRGTDLPLEPRDIVKLSTDAMLDALILQFEPKRKQ